MEQGVEPARPLGDELAEGARRAREQGCDHLAEGVCLVGQDARGHLVEHHPDGPEVSAMIDGLGVAELLRRHVREGAHHRAGHGGARGLGVALAHHLGDAEIEELDGAARLADEDVVRLEISVNQARGVGRREGVEDLEEHLANRLEGQGPAPSSASSVSPCKSSMTR